MSFKRTQPTAGSFLHMQTVSRHNSTKLRRIAHVHLGRFCCFATIFVSVDVYARYREDGADQSAEPKQMAEKQFS